MLRILCKVVAAVVCFIPLVAASLSFVFAEGNLFYLKNSTELHPGDLATLESVACHAIATKNRVLLEGYASADERDPERLSLRRAVEVKDSLIRHGVNAEKIGIAAYGTKRPAASDKVPEGRARNRRVDFSAGMASSAPCGAMHRGRPRT